jgi:hypothetical protein
MTPSGQSDTPRSSVERAADAGLRAVEAALETEGGRAVRIFVAVQADDVEGLDCTTAGSGYDGGRELLVELLGHASGCAKALGLDLQIVTAPVRGQG